jgi:hypothetical protein
MYMYYALLYMQVSEHLLSIYLDEYPDTPWDALKYLVSEQQCNNTCIHN